MKKFTLLLVTILLVQQFLFAQVMKINQMEYENDIRIFVREIQHGDVIKMGTEEEHVIFTSDVINTSNTAQIVNLKLEVFDYTTEGIDMWGCWGEYLPPWDFRFNPVEILAQGSEIFNVDYVANGILDGKLWVKCTFLIDDKEDFMFHIKFGNFENTVKETIATKNNAYPNPMSNILNIENENISTIPEIKIYSIQGVLLLHTQGNQIDVSSLSSGIYIAEIDGVCQKIIKK